MGILGHQSTKPKLKNWGLWSVLELEDEDDGDTHLLDVGEDGTLDEVGV